jgi:hypothetical protein
MELLPGRDIFTGGSQDCYLAVSEAVKFSQLFHPASYKISMDSRRMYDLSYHIIFLSSPACFSL